MDISQRGIDFIVDFEGKYTLLPDGRYQAYLDKIASPPVWTLYCGLTKGVHEGMIRTEEECERMFRKELAIYEDAIERFVTVPLNQNMFDALVSFVYNCGVGALKRSTLLELLNQGKYASVPAQLMRWVNAGGKPINGLIRRRKAEGALFMEPVPEEAAVPVADDNGETPPPEMPQRVEEAPAGKVTEVIKESVTLRGAALAFLGTIAGAIQQGYDWLFAVAKDAGPEILSLRTTVSPFDPLLKITPAILTGLVVIGIGIVVVRKIQDHIEGKAV